MNGVQVLAINRMNRALKALKDADISICGMDSDLLYATNEACKNTTNDNDYCDVARANQFSDEDTGWAVDALNGTTKIMGLD